MGAPDLVADYLAFARTLTHKVAGAIRRAQRRGFESRVKADGSIVTDVDEAIERFMRAAILRRYPEHGIVGEEFPSVSGNAYTWVLDPVDGTDNFMNGIPTFGSLLSLYRDDEPVVATLSHPALHLEYSAARGLGTYVNGVRLKPRAGPLGEPIVITNAPANFARRRGGAERLARIQNAFPNTRIYRDCFAHSRVVMGAAAAAVDANVRWWDVAATRLLVEEAGGQFNELERWTRADGVVYYTVAFGQAAVVARLSALMECQD